jgi:hypothetical protein
MQNLPQYMVGQLPPISIIGTGRGMFSWGGLLDISVVSFYSSNGSFSCEFHLYL